jgi:hypothetical protein
MAVLEYDGIGTGSFLYSKANGYRSQQTVTLKADEVVKAGMILGVVTATGEYAKYNPSNSDGTETVAGISYADVDATGASKEIVAFVRDCEVNGKLLTYSNGADASAIATANTELEALGIIVR